ncbi:hypothetical protein NXV15_24025 [Bacteroides thetaiotaomicron]|nr:hypothetical protein [Bacteroides thetaiotaomicron]MCS2687411.1 hypothetical protein [Bacteroides thetaiotaomicron]
MSRNSAGMAIRFRSNSHRNSVEMGESLITI